MRRPLVGWRPVCDDTGASILFDGWLDDIDSLGAELGRPGASAAELYLTALRRWGDLADARINGHYATIVTFADRRVRLARSPWSSPPLHYANDGARAIIASVPRVLLSAGIPARLDPVKLADNLVCNLVDDERGWYRECWRVPQGSIVHLGPGTRRTIRWYDPHAATPVRLSCDEDYVQAARKLIGRAADNALVGTRQPGIALSGGLDSALIAAELLQRTPAGSRLRSFTFRPLANWDGRINPDQMGDEKSFVDAFAALHPALEPSFTRNEAGGFDHRLRELFAAMGTAPGYLGNYYVYHGVWQGARDAGCDWLFDATLGNQTFSNDGRWSYVEYLLRLRWNQLRLVLSRRRGDHRTLLRKFASLSLLPLLPSRWRDPIRRLRHPGLRSISEMASMMAADFNSEQGVEKRAKRDGAWRDATYPRSHRESVALDYLLADFESSDIHQGFEQVYGLRRRDVTGYRPLIEFCLGLPTSQFVRDGKERWLAKRLAVGRLPEAQIHNPGYGRHDVDWHARIGPRRSELLTEIGRIAAVPKLAAMFDIPRMRAALEDWPNATPLAPQEALPREIGLTRALVAARFVNFIEGRNDV